MHFTCRSLYPVRGNRHLYIQTCFHYIPFSDFISVIPLYHRHASPIIVMPVPKMCLYMIKVLDVRITCITSTGSHDIIYWLASIDPAAVLLSWLTVVIYYSFANKNGDHQSILQPPKWRSVKPTGRLLNIYISSELIWNRITPVICVISSYHFTCSRTTAKWIKRVWVREHILPSDISSRILCIAFGVQIMVYIHSAIAAWVERLSLWSSIPDFKSPGLTTDPTMKLIIF